MTRRGGELVAVAPLQGSAAAPLDAAAFALVFRKYARMVHGIGLSRVTPAEADDLVQDVFLAAMENLHALAHVEAVGGWLAQIARNRAHDVLRRRKRAPPESDVGPSGSACGPEDAAEARRILAKIQALPEAYRETLVLRLVEGLTGPEIAEQVGLTPDSVRVNLHRGMKLLREAL